MMPAATGEPEDCIPISFRGGFMSTKSFPVSETSRLLNTSDFTIRRLIKTKELRAVRIGGQWRIFEEDLVAYLNDRENRPREMVASSCCAHSCASGSSLKIDD
jgi:excisionase family DNA binding protein